MTSYFTFLQYPKIVGVILVIGRWGYLLNHVNTSDLNRYISTQLTN